MNHMHQNLCIEGKASWVENLSPAMERGIDSRNRKSGTE
jgi:hypothetical protein